MSDTDTTKRCPPIDVTVGRWSIRTNGNETCPLSVELDKGYIGDFSVDDLKGLGIAMFAVIQPMKAWAEAQS